MFVKNIKLASFRNYSKLGIEFIPGFNIIYGDNAQGKTNIIEAIFLCSAGRSHRTSKDEELIKLGDSGYYVKLGLSSQDIDSAIEIHYTKEEKKKIKINDIAAKKMGNLMGHLKTVIFSPEDLMVIKEGPSERRRFIDITICQIKPSYFYDLQQYNKILSQRNSLLKELQEKRSLIDTLEIWNNNLVSVGARIIKLRNDFINQISKNIKQNHYKLTGGNEELSLKYLPSVATTGFNDIKEIEQMFLKMLEASVNKEIIRGTTLSGPQRDDFELYINNMSLKQYGSQGQQRTAVLAMKLSEIQIMKEDSGQYPVLLLDDVMSELDKYRQQYLFECLKDIQTFITSTDLSFLKEKANIDYALFKVTNGYVVKN